MSDILFDENRCRNIMVDIRYVLWIIDHYVGAGHLVDDDNSGIISYAIRAIEITTIANRNSAKQLVLQFRFLLVLRDVPFLNNFAKIHMR